MIRHTRRASAFAAAVVVLLATGCVSNAPAGRQPLAQVSPLPSPSPLGPVAKFMPVGDVDTLAQIRVTFVGDLIPLERLESPDENAALAHFSIEPALPGHFRFLTPRMIGFEADRAWPAATRVRVTITKGLRDQRGDTLDQDLSWTFQTDGISIEGLPGKDDTSLRTLRPRLTITSNVALDRASLQARATVRPHDGGDAIQLLIPADTASATPTPAVPGGDSPELDYDPANKVWRYALEPFRELAKGKRYDVLIQAGVLPRDGNVPSDAVFTGDFRTYDALAFTGTSAAPGERFTSGAPKLSFSNPIDPNSLNVLTLSPAPPAGSTAFAVTDGGVVVNTALLAPNTSYTVGVGAALRDTFGQTLGSATSATFKTGDLTPDVWAPSGTNLFPSGRDVRLNVVAVNAPSGVRAIFHPLQPRDVVQYPDPDGYGRNDVLPDRETWPPFDARGPHNVERTFTVPLQAKLGAPAGALAYGVSASIKQGSPFAAAGVVQLTDLGVFAQFFPDGGIVHVNRIADGSPAAGARVEVYASQVDAASKKEPVACATATTDAQGIARLGGAGYAQCGATNALDTAPSLVTVVRRGADWTYVRSSDGSGAYEGDFYNGWNAGIPVSRGTIYSDRDLYQPGETAHMTAVGWFLIDGVLKRGTAASYALQLEAPNGDKRDIGRAALDAFGSFSVPVVIPKSAPLGYYVLHAVAGNGEEITGDFRVAEFKPPNFKVDLAVDHDVVQRGATVNATAANAYLFGAPLTGASTKFSVTRSPTSFTPKNRDAFSFGRQWFWPEQRPDATTDVLERTITVDANGKSAITVPVGTDLPFPMQYQVDADTTDASNVDVADSKTFTALPTATLIGLKADDVGTAGTPLNVDVIATDPSGAAKTGTSVHVELQKANYASA
ncbi:MAG: alpha-2-macroglobulin family protein, partial [Candidatus Eremiobacteraeota bacterium]|nr:alpha-2-macroglobulin family protein [Candidatus Eremiobacteraeota bacterium]